MLPIPPTIIPYIGLIYPATGVTEINPHRVPKEIPIIVGFFPVLMVSHSIQAVIPAAAAKFVDKIALTAIISA